MPDLTKIIPQVRDSVVAVLRVHVVHRESVKRGKVRQAQLACNIGSGFCVLADKYLISADHVLHDAGRPRDPQDHFYALAVPGNGGPYYIFPIVGFPVEQEATDVAVLEIGPCATPGIHIPAIALSLESPVDGSPVVTVGCPAPELGSVRLDAEGNFGGGPMFLKTHANEGIVAAQYALAFANVFELNVGWHHGESGGPIVTATDPPAAFSLMQGYRNVQSPHGVLPGPHRGVTLACISAELAALGIPTV